jgi:hypothetical protein
MTAAKSLRRDIGSAPFAFAFPECLLPRRYWGKADVGKISLSGSVFDPGVSVKTRVRTYGDETMPRVKQASKQKRELRGLGELRELRGLRGLLGSVPRLRVSSRTKSAAALAMMSIGHRCFGAISTNKA